MKVKEFFDMVKKRFNCDNEEIARRLSLDEEDLEKVLQDRQRVSIELLDRVTNQIKNLENKTDEEVDLEREYWNEFIPGVKERSLDYPKVEKEKIKEKIEEIKIN